MIIRVSKILLLLLLMAVFVLSGFSGFVWSQGAGEDKTQSELIDERSVLEQELAELEKEISQYEGNVEEARKRKKTLENEIYYLRSKIATLNLQITQTDTMIKDVSIQINDTESSIDKTAVKIEELRAVLKDVLRLIYEKDQLSPVEILLAGDQLSDFFEQVVALESLNARNQEYLENIKNLKTSLYTQKESLDDEKQDLEQLIQIQFLQKQENQRVKTDQEGLLDITKGEEEEYQKLLADRQKRASEIRARIFELVGVPEAPTFGEALELAYEVEALTGVRPAFLLAVITQESNLGKNVGQCQLSDPETGEGIRIKTGEKIDGVMAPGPPFHKRRNDVEFFLAIAEELGRDPYELPVSCPINNSRMGLIAGKNSWGGAMGPAQFIPATWADKYSSPTKVPYSERVEEITGAGVADPWNIKHAFIASALYLTDYGAKSQNENKEWRAAMIYFSGSTNTKYRFYGDSVLRIAEQYEDDIKNLE